MLVPWMIDSLSHPLHARCQSTPALPPLPFCIFRLAPHTVVNAGHPVHWERVGVGAANFQSTIKDIAPEKLISGHIRQQELAMARMEEASVLFGRTVCKQARRRGCGGAAPARGTLQTGSTIPHLRQLHCPPASGG